jgi:MoxR-like ATPase
MTAREEMVRIEADLNTVAYGMGETLHVVTAATAAGLPTLLEGPHGTFKTSLVKRIAQYFGEEAFYRQIKPEMTKHDVFYTYDVGQMVKEGTQKVIPLAVGAKFVGLDEFLKHPTLGPAVHDFIEEHNIDGIPANWLMIFGMTNPANEYYATNIALQDFATKDRWAVGAYVEAVQPYMLFELGKRVEREFKPERPTFTVPLETLATAREEIKKIPMQSSLHMWLQLLLSELYVCEFTPNGVAHSQSQKINKWMMVGRSIESFCAMCRHKEEVCAKASAMPARAQRSVIWLAKSLAWLEGTDKVTQEQLLMAARYCLPHRIHFSSGHLADYPTMRTAFDAILKKYDENSENRQKIGVFKPIKDLLVAVSEGKWNAEVYASIEKPFHDDLPIVHFIRGLREARYLPLIASLRVKVATEKDSVKLMAMKEALADMGLETDDIADLRKQIDGRMAGEVITVPFGSGNAGKIVAALAGVADAKKLDAALTESVASANRDPNQVSGEFPVGPFVTVSANDLSQTWTLAVSGEAAKKAAALRKLRGAS